MNSADSEKLIESLGHNIKMKRTEKGMSQAALAKAAGCAAGFVSAMEKKIRVPNLKITFDLANALGCTLNDLCYGNRPQTNAELYLLQRCRGLTDDDIYMLASIADVIAGRRIKDTEKGGRKDGT